MVTLYTDQDHIAFVQRLNNKLLTENLEREDIIINYASNPRLLIQLGLTPVVHDIPGFEDKYRAASTLCFEAWYYGASDDELLFWFDNDSKYLNEHMKKENRN
jgi:hypothetical protein